MKTFKEFLEEGNKKPMSAAARRKKSIAMSRMMKSSKMQKKIAKAKTRRSSPDKLWAKAQKAAKMKIIKKAMPKVNYNSLPIMQKMIIDKNLAKKFMKIPLIAKKMIIKLRKSENERVAAARTPKDDDAPGAE